MSQQVCRLLGGVETAKWGRDESTNWQQRWVLISVHRTFQVVLWLNADAGRGFQNQEVGISGLASFVAANQLNGTKLSPQL